MTTLHEFVFTHQDGQHDLAVRVARATCGNARLPSSSLWFPMSVEINTGIMSPTAFGILDWLRLPPPRPGQAGQAGTGKERAAIGHCGNYATAAKEHDELIALADEKGSLTWKALCTPLQGCLFALTGKPSDAVQRITSGVAALRSTGTTLWMPLHSSYFARAYAELGRFDDAWRSIGEGVTAAETMKATWFGAEVNRIAGEIALLAPEPNAAKAEAYFERALSVARQQKAKSWELRAAMSMARLWRDQGKRDEARELLAPVYGWFTEGFDTLDLKEAKALLEGLAA